MRYIYQSSRFNDKSAIRRIFSRFQLYARAYVRIWTQRSQESLPAMIIKLAEREILRLYFSSLLFKNKAKNTIKCAYSKLRGESKKMTKR